MRHYENKTETITRSNLVKTTCDLCGAAEGKSDRWPYQSHHFDETSFEHRYGTSWPEGSGHSLTIDLDICPACTREKVIPALEAIAGKKFEYKEVDW